MGLTYVTAAGYLNYMDMYRRTRETSEILDLIIECDIELGVDTREQLLD